MRFAYNHSITYINGNYYDPDQNSKLKRAQSKILAQIKITAKAAFTALTVIILARPEGFEPPTFWFVARHSIQLS